MQIINIEIEEGIPYTLSLTYVDETTNLPIDVTGYTAELVVRKAFGSDEIFLQLSSESGGIILDGATGNIDATIPEGITWIKASYELLLINPSSNRIKLAKGFINVLVSATIP